MKNILVILTFLAVIITVSSCGNKKKKAEDNVEYHTHADGTVHRNDAHSHNNNEKPNQESFEVEADNDAEHKHEAGDKNEHGHEHGDEAGHDHDHDHGEHR